MTDVVGESSGAGTVSVAQCDPDAVRGDGTATGCADATAGARGPGAPARPRILALFGGVVPFGQERGNIEALAALREQGCEVLCLISDAPWNTRIPHMMDERGLAWRKVPFVTFRVRGNIAGFLLKNPVSFVRANLAALRVNRTFRATHFHSMNFAYVLNFLIFLSAGRAVPLIYRAGDAPPDAWRWRFLWKLASRRVTRFVAISEFIRGALADAGIGSRIDVIYNHPPARKTGSAGGGDASAAVPRFDFVYVGQITAAKGVSVLVEAFAALLREYPDTRLGIVGRISEEGEWDAWARDLRDRTLGDATLARRVVFTGYRDDVHSVLDRSGILVAPSLWNEPLGNVVMEAKQAGRAAIVFPRGGLPEMIRHGTDGLVCPEATAEALRKAMRFYLEKPACVAEHGQAARQSLERFGTSRFGERWLEIYESTPGPGSASGPAPRRDGGAAA